MYLYCDCHLFNIMSIKSVKRLELFSVKRYIKFSLLLLLLLLLLSGSPQYLIQLLQKVQNTAARITHRAPRSEHTSPLLRSLHWLPVQKRIKHKVCSICYTTLTGASPKYMSELVNVYTPMPALIIRQPYSHNPLCENQDLWAAFLCLSRTNYMEWTIIWPKTQRFTVHFQSALKTHLFYHLT